MLLTEQMATYDTRLPREVSAEALAALDAYAELVGRAERAYCARYSRGDKVNKKAFMAEFGLNGRQFNAIERHIKGLAQSQASNRANYIDDDRARLEKNQETLEALCKALDKANAAGDQAGAGKLLGKINGKLAYGWKVSDRLAQRQADADAGRVTLCLGGRQLFAKQFNLSANGYASHAAWLADWRDSRRNHILCVGCQSEPWGNRNAQLMPDGPDTFTLRLNLPPALHARFGKTLTLRGLRFARPGALERIRAVYAEQQNRAVRQGIFRALGRAGKAPAQPDPDDPWQQATLDNFCSGFGQAVTVRLVRDNKRGWRLFLSFAVRCGQTVIDRDKADGVVAIDINAGFLSLVELDAEGSVVTAYDLPLPREDAGGMLGTRRYLTALQEAAKVAAGHARRVGKPLALERLDFSGKKRAMRGQPARRNHTLSSFGYRRIGDALARRSAFDGVAVVRVSAAWTSVIGRFAHRDEHGGSVHTGAAIAIGRRAMGREKTLQAFLSEKPVGCFCSLRGRTVWFGAPEDAQTWAPVAKRFRHWCREQSRCLRQQTRDWRTGLTASVRRQTASDVPL